MHNKGRFMGDIEVFMAKGYDRKQAIESARDRPDDDDQFSGESVQNRRDDSANSVRSSSEYDDKRRRYRAARETSHKGMTTNSRSSMKTGDMNKHNNGGRPYHDEFNLYESRDIEEFTSSEFKTLIELNPLQAEKQFSSIANIDFNNISRISAVFNGTDSMHANKSHSEKKASTGHNILNLSASQPQSKSTSNSSNLSSPFANMPKFKVTVSDDEGSDSEYGGEIKYYDLNRWNRKDNRGDGVDLDGLMMNGDGEYSNLRRVCSLTELLALKDKGKPAASTELQKPQANRQQQQQQQQQQRQHHDMRDQAIQLLHGNSSDNVEHEQETQQKSGPSVPSNVDEREIQWLMSIGYTHEQAVLLDRTRMGSNNLNTSREASGGGHMDHQADHATEHVSHRQLQQQQQGRNGNPSSGRESSRHYYEAQANSSLKGGGSSLPSDTAERIRHGNVPADTPPSATKKAAAASSQFEIDNDLAQLMKKGYTREQAYQVVQQAMAQQQQKQQQQQQQLLQQRQILEQSYSASDYGSVEPNHSASVHSRYSQRMHVLSTLVGQENDLISVSNRYSQKMHASSSVVGQENDVISIHLGSLMSKGYTLEQAQQLLLHKSTSPQLKLNRQEILYPDHNSHHSFSQQQQRSSPSSRYSLLGSSPGSPPQYMDPRRQQYFASRGDDAGSVVSSREYYANNYVPQPPQLSSPSRLTFQTHVRMAEGADHNTFGSRYMKSVQSLGENEAMKIVLLLSEQEAAYGTNMYDSLTERDGADIERQVGAGISTDEAILTIFRKKIANTAVNGTSRSSATASVSASSSSSSSAPSPQQNSQQHLGRDTLDRGSASPIENDLASASDNATVRSAATRPESSRQPATISGDRPESRNNKKTFFGFSSYFPFSSKSRSPESNHSPNVGPDDHGESVNTKRHASSSPDLTSNSFNEIDVKTLMALEFTRPQSIDALHLNNGDVRRAALHLLSKS